MAITAFGLNSKHTKAPKEPNSLTQFCCLIYVVTKWRFCSRFVLVVMKGGNLPFLSREAREANIDLFATGLMTGGNFEDGSDRGFVALNGQQATPHECFCRGPCTCIAFGML